MFVYPPNTAYRPLRHERGGNQDASDIELFQVSQ
jgi:hypothetical protein